jgi:DNA-binding CsgD family transcriptional regulator
VDAFGIDAGDRDVYLELARSPGHALASLAQACGRAEAAVEASLRRLRDAGLVTDGDTPLGLRACSPAVRMAVGLAEERSALQRREADLTRLSGVVASLTADYESARDPEIVVRHDSLEETRGRLEELALSAKVECLSLNPGRAQPPDARAAGKPLNQLALERGVAIRCVYQDAFRNDADTLAYVTWLVGLGGDARTMPVVPLQVVIVDRVVALLPLDPDDPRRGAVEVQGPSIVTALCALFDQLWTGGTPFHLDRPRPAEATANAEREVLRLLAGGLTDEAVARRMQVSVRTVRRLVADACERLGASSRFTAGMLAERRGWLG